MEERGCYVTLTPRQTDVLGLVARGLTCHRAGQLLGISEHTVKDHLKACRLELGARNTAHAVNIALHERIIVP